MIGTYMVSRDASTGAMNLTTGFYCDIKESKNQDGLGVLPDEAEIAYEGPHTSPRGNKARAFTYSVDHTQNNDIQAYLYRFKVNPCVHSCLK